MIEHTPTEVAMNAKIIAEFINYLEQHQEDVIRLNRNFERKWVVDLVRVLQGQICNYLATRQQDDYNAIRRTCKGIVNTFGGWDLWADMLPMWVPEGNSKKKACALSARTSFFAKCKN